MNAPPTIPDSVAIPQQLVGPLRLTGPVLDESLYAPLATYETPLWASCNRGARVTQHAGGIETVIVRDCMARSILLNAPGARVAAECAAQIESREEELAEIVAQTSRFARLKQLHIQVAARSLFIRLSINSGDASGHNMVTLAADHATTWLLQQFPALQYVSVSGNLCTDKKASAINGILGRGKHVIAETNISRKLCARFLNSTPEDIARLNHQKNYLGLVLAGGVATANAHFANMLLGFYLATGQDAANIIEGSQGTVTAEACDDGLYFAVTLPNVIVGAVGNGKHLPQTRANLDLLGCLAERPAGDNARRLAAICAAVVLCGELSLLAALTNRGELMAAHQKLERK